MDTTAKLKEKPQDSRRVLGLKGEDAACEFLSRQGLKIIDRNWRCSYGEADIIALDGHCLVFIEVKTRKAKVFEQPADYIRPRQAKRYLKLVAVYRSRMSVRHSSVRFDFISVLVNRENKSARLHYLRDAYAQN